MQRIDLHAGGQRRLQPGRAVFDHRAMRRRHAQGLGRVQEQAGLGLEMTHLVGAEQALRAEEAMQAREAQREFGLGARPVGGHGHRSRPRLQLPQQAAAPGMGCRPWRKRCAVARRTRARNSASKPAARPGRWAAIQATTWPMRTPRKRRRASSRPRLRPSSSASACSTSRPGSSLSTRVPSQSNSQARGHTDTAGSDQVAQHIGHLGQARQKRCTISSWV
jgi:hypothetical protein